jgi:hypothetical protein
MGSSAVPLFETTNYKWWMKGNHSGAYVVYSFYIENKGDGARVELRRESEDDSAGVRESDAAWAELNKEHTARFCQGCLTKEQVALADMWARMTAAEEKARQMEWRLGEFERVFADIRKLPEPMRRD